MAKRPKTPAFPALDDEQRLALATFAAKHGRSWRDELSLRWSRAQVNYPDGVILYRPRNTHGPSWLYSFKMQTEVTP
jgi:hypothetical protein